MRKQFILAGLILAAVAGCSAQGEETYHFVKAIGREGSGQGEFREPIGIAIDGDGFLLKIA